MAAPKESYLSSEEVVSLLEQQLPEDGCLTPLQEVVFEYHTVYLIREYYKRNPNKLFGKEKIFAEKLPFLKNEEVYLWFLSLDKDYYTEMVVDGIEGFISKDLFNLCWIDETLYDKIQSFIDGYDGLFYNHQNFILQCAYLGKYLKSLGYKNNLDDELILLGLQHWSLEKIAEYIKIERFNIFTIPENDERIDKILRFIYLNIEEMPKDYIIKFKETIWDDETKQAIPILDDDGRQSYSIRTMETKLEEMKKNLFSFKCYGAEYMRTEYATDTSKLAYLFGCLKEKGLVCNNWQHLIEKRCYFLDKRDKKIKARTLASLKNGSKLVTDKDKTDESKLKYDEIKRFVESL